MDQDYIRYAEAKIAVKRGHSFVLPESFFFFFFNKCIHLKLKSVSMLQEVYYSHFIIHCVKRVRIRSYSGLHFRIWSISSYSVRIRKNADQNNSEYGHFSRSDNFFLSCHSCVTEACKVYGAASFMSNDFNSYVTNPSI